MITREELILNLRETSEISHEIIRIEKELSKRMSLLQETVKESKETLLKTVKDQYYQSDDYNCHYIYQQQLEQLQQTGENLILVINIVITIICGIFIYFELPLFNIAVFWLIAPNIIYFPYLLKKWDYIKKKKPKTILKSIDVVLEEVEENLKLRTLPDSLLATYIKQEIGLLKDQKAEKERILSAKTFLPIEYQLRENEILYFLENRRLDNLKEALHVIDEADYRKRINQVLMTHLEEIKALQERIDELIH